MAHLLNTLRAIKVNVKVEGERRKALPPDPCVLKASRRWLVLVVLALDHAVRGNRGIAASLKLLAMSANHAPISVAGAGGVGNLVLSGVTDEVCAGRLAEAKARMLKGAERACAVGGVRQAVFRTCRPEGRWLAGAPEPKQTET